MTVDPDVPNAGSRLTVPVFPLPNVVFFPKTFLPLHIFERRYRSMVGESLKKDKLIAMTLLEEGWEEDYTGTPDVHTTACVGKIEFSEHLSSGKYNILLFGLYKVHLLDFVRSSPYREAEVRVLHDVMPLPESHRRMPHRDVLLELADEVLPGKLSAIIGDPSLMKEMEYESLVNTLAMAGPFSEKIKQDMLELDDIGQRAEQLEKLLKDSARVRRYFKSLHYIHPRNAMDN